MRRILIFACIFLTVCSLSAQQDNNTILKKGITSCGFQIGFSKNETTNDRLLTLIDIEKIKTTGVKFSLSGSYFIADNIAWNAKIDYAFSDNQYQINANILSLLIESKDYSYNNASSSFSAGMGIKNFVPLFNNRFYVFNETNITYSYINSLTRDIYDYGAIIKKSFKTTHEIQIGLSPGVMYFLTRGFAFEFAFHPIMVYYSRSFITNDDVQHGDKTDYALDFQFNIFNISLGFAYYFGIK